MKTLTPKEICKFLQENHCRLVEQNITKPEPTQIRELYLCLVNIFTPGRRDEINYTLDQLRQTQPNFEYHEQNEKAYLIFKDLEYLLSFTNYKGLKYMDVLDPQQQSIVKILSIIIDFIKFRGDLWEIFNKSYSVYEEKDQACRKKQDKIEQFDAEYPDAKHEYDENMAKIEQLKQSINVVDDALIKLRSEGHGYSSKLDAYKKERSALKDKMQEIQYNTIGYENELAKLKEAERFDKEGTIEKNNKLRHDMAQIDIDLKKDQATLKERRREIEQKKTVIDKIKAGLDDLLEAKKVDVAYEKFLKEKRTLTAQIEKLDTNIARLEKDQMLLVEQMRKYDYKIQQVDANLAKRREEFTQFNQDYRKRLEDAYQECQAVDTACAEMAKKTKEYNRKIELVKRRDKEREEYAEKKLFAINQALLDYQKALEDATKDE